MRIWISIIVITAAAVVTCPRSLWAQTELGGSSGPSNNWVMLSATRTWVPQLNGQPNGGFGVHSFFSVDDRRSTWVGFSVVGTGVGDRAALLVNGGAGWWFVGQRQLGGYAYGMTGLGITSNNAITGFDYFSDVSTTYGLASQVGVGMSVELFKLFTAHANLWAVWMTNDAGRTPYGLQVGLTFGGR